MLKRTFSSKSFWDILKRRMAENPPNAEAVTEAAKPVSEKTKMSGGGIQVSSRQKGNPILKFVRNVPWEFTDSIVPGNNKSAFIKICTTQIS